MFERAKADPAGIELLVKESKGKMKFVIDTNPYFIYVKPRKNGKDNEDVLTLVRSLTEKMIKIWHVMYDKLLETRMSGMF